MMKKSLLKRIGRVAYIAAFFLAFAFVSGGAALAESAPQDGSPGVPAPPDTTADSTGQLPAPDSAPSDNAATPDKAAADQAATDDAAEKDVVKTGCSQLGTPPVSLVFFLFVFGAMGISWKLRQSKEAKSPTRRQ